MLGRLLRPVANDFAANCSNCFFSKTNSSFVESTYPHTLLTTTEPQQSCLPTQFDSDSGRLVRVHLNTSWAEHAAFAAHASCPAFAAASGAHNYSSESVFLFHPRLGLLRFIQVNTNGCRTRTNGLANDVSPSTVAERTVFLPSSTVNQTKVRARPGSRLPSFELFVRLPTD